jgi:hypothetical protein
LITCSQPPDKAASPHQDRGLSVASIFNDDAMNSLTIKDFDFGQQSLLVHVVSLDESTFSGEEDIMLPEAKRRHRDSVKFMLHVEDCKRRRNWAKFRQSKNVHM